MLPLRLVRLGSKYSDASTSTQGLYACLRAFLPSCERLVPNKAILCLLLPQHADGLLSSTALKLRKRLLKVLEQRNKDADELFEAVDKLLGEYVVR